MQLILDIKDDSILDKLLWMLEHFKDDGIKIKKIKNENISECEPEYDIEYEKSFQYKLDRADFIEMKENL